MKLKVDFHVHSNKSFDGLMSYDEIIKNAKRAGLDAVAICDHEVANTQPLCDGDVLIIPGIEMYTQYGHVLGLFINSFPDGKSDDERIENVKKNGGIVVLAHPFEKHKTSDKFDNSIYSFQAIESLNSRACKNNCNANLQGKSYAQSKEMIAISGSDAHHRKEIGNAYTVLECDDKSIDSIKSALLNNNIELLHCDESKYKYTSISQRARIKNKKLSFGFKCKWLLSTVKCFALDLTRKKQHIEYKPTGAKNVNNSQNW